MANNLRSFNRQFIVFLFGLIFLGTPQIGWCEEYVEYAMGCAARKDYEGALDMLNRGLIVHPADTAEILLNRGAILELMGKHAEALTDENQAIYLFRRKPTDKYALATAYANRGTILKSLKQSSKALESYKLALNTRPADAQANEYYALMLAKRGRVREALEHLEISKKSYVKISDQKSAGEVNELIRKLKNGEPVSSD